MKRLRDMEGDEPLFQRGVEVLQGTLPTGGNAGRQAAGVAFDPARAGDDAAPPADPDPEAGAGGDRRFRRGNGGRGDRAPLATCDGCGTRQRGVDASAIDVPAPRPEKASPIPAVAETASAGRHGGAGPAPQTPARSAPKKLASLPPSAASVARERTEVLDALVALRREHDPVRAGTLLARYLSAHPRGALREEALVLAIEAADARGDRTGGEQLAQAYQTEFPAGRFLPFARSHTDGQGSH